MNDPLLQKLLVSDSPSCSQDVVLKGDDQLGDAHLGDACEGNVRFLALHEQAPAGTFLGVPFFSTAHTFDHGSVSLPSSATLPPSATFLFNIWAFYLGPVYYLCKGLWRKTLTWVLLYTLTALALGFWDYPAESLAGILSNMYLGATLGVSAALLVFLMLLFTGNTLWALLVAALSGVSVLYGDALLLHVDVGISSGFMWILSLSVWPALVSVLFFQFLARRPVEGGVTVLTGLALYFLGLPWQDVAPQSIVFACFEVLAGMMGTWDMYRHKVLKQRFWW